MIDRRIKGLFPYLNRDAQMLAVLAFSPRLVSATTFGLYSTTIPTTTVVRRLLDLQDKGIVVASFDPNDRRKTYYQLTETGALAAEDLVARINEALE